MNSAAYIQQFLVGPPPPMATPQPTSPDAGARGRNGGIRRRGDEHCSNSAPYGWRVLPSASYSHAHSSPFPQQATTTARPRALQQRVFELLRSSATHRTKASNRCNNGDRRDATATHHNNNNAEEDPMLHILAISLESIMVQSQLATAEKRLLKMNKSRSGPHSDGAAAPDPAMKAAEDGEEEEVRTFSFIIGGNGQSVGGGSEEGEKKKAAVVRFAVPQSLLFAPPDTEEEDNDNDDGDAEGEGILVKNSSEAMGRGKVKVRREGALDPFTVMPLDLLVDMLLGASSSSSSSPDGYRVVLTGQCAAVDAIIDDDSSAAIGKKRTRTLVTIEYDVAVRCNADAVMSSGKGKRDEDGDDGVASSLAATHRYHDGPPSSSSPNDARGPSPIIMCRVSFACGGNGGVGDGTTEGLPAVDVVIAADKIGVRAKEEKQRGVNNNTTAYQKKRRKTAASSSQPSFELLLSAPLTLTLRAAGGEGTRITGCGAVNEGNNDKASEVRLPFNCFEKLAGDICNRAATSANDDGDDGDRLLPLFPPTRRCQPTPPSDAEPTPSTSTVHALVPDVWREVLQYVCPVATLVALTAVSKHMYLWLNHGELIQSTRELRRRHSVDTHNSIDPTSDHRGNTTRYTYNNVQLSRLYLERWLSTGPSTLARVRDHCARPFIAAAAVAHGGGGMMGIHITDDGQHQPFSSPRGAGPAAVDNHGCFLLHPSHVFMTSVEYSVRCGGEEEEEEDNNAANYDDGRGIAGSTSSACCSVGVVGADRPIVSVDPFYIEARVEMSDLASVLVRQTAKQRPNDKNKNNDCSIETVALAKWMRLLEAMGMAVSSSPSFPSSSAVSFASAIVQPWYSAALHSQAIRAMHAIHRQLLNSSSSSSYSFDAARNGYQGSNSIKCNEGPLSLLRPSEILPTSSSSTSSSLPFTEDGILAAVNSRIGVLQHQLMEEEENNAGEEAAAAHHDRYSDPHSFEGAALVPGGSDGTHQCKANTTATRRTLAYLRALAESLAKVLPERFPNPNYVDPSLMATATIMRDGSGGDGSRSAVFGGGFAVAPWPAASPSQYAPLPSNFVKTIPLGSKVDALDTVRRWYVATIVGIDDGEGTIVGGGGEGGTNVQDNNTNTSTNAAALRRVDDTVSTLGRPRIKIHYDVWGDKWDEWMDVFVPNNQNNINQNAFGAAGGGALPTNNNMRGLPRVGGGPLNFRLDCVHHYNSNVAAGGGVGGGMRGSVLIGAPIAPWPITNVSQLAVGMQLQARDTVNMWLPATITAVEAAGDGDGGEALRTVDRIRISYNGWSAQWDEWIPLVDPSVNNNNNNNANNLAARADGGAPLPPPPPPPMFYRSLGAACVALGFTSATDLSTGHGTTLTTTTTTGSPLRGGGGAAAAAPPRMPATAGPSSPPSPPPPPPMALNPRIALLHTHTGARRPAVPLTGLPIAPPIANAAPQEEEGGEVNDDDADAEGEEGNGHRNIDQLLNDLISETMMTNTNANTTMGRNKATARRRFEACVQQRIELYRPRLLTDVDSPQRFVRSEMRPFVIINNNVNGSGSSWNWGGGDASYPRQQRQESVRHPSLLPFEQYLTKKQLMSNGNSPMAIFDDGVAPERDTASEALLKLVCKVFPHLFSTDGDAFAVVGGDAGVGGVNSFTVNTFDVFDCVRRNSNSNGNGGNGGWSQNMYNPNSVDVGRGTPLHSSSSPPPSSSPSAHPNYHHHHHRCCEIPNVVDPLFESQFLRKDKVVEWMERGPRRQRDGGGSRVRQHDTNGDGGNPNPSSSSSSSNANDNKYTMHNKYTMNSIDANNSNSDEKPMVVVAALMTFMLTTADADNDLLRGEGVSSYKVPPPPPPLHEDGPSGSIQGGGGRHGAGGGVSPLHRDGQPDNILVAGFDRPNANDNNDDLDHAAAPPSSSNTSVCIAPMAPIAARARRGRVAVIFKQCYSANDEVFLEGIMVLRYGREKDSHGY